MGNALQRDAQAQGKEPQEESSDPEEGLQLWGRRKLLEEEIDPCRIFLLLPKEHVETL